ncbi:MAG TPA: cupin domain-containing protein [Tepidisphaeraceae bacterium]|nr:cupin domain-containing protein [Tepidisphaeraceae bacterium]
MQPAPPQPITIKNLFDISKNPASLKWEFFRPGVKIHRLYGNQDSGPSAALLWYEPGAGMPLHEHLGYEHILILANTQSDENGENDAGALIINPPGSAHTVSMSGGGVVLAIWERPVTFKEPLAASGVENLTTR